MIEITHQQAQRLLRDGMDSTRSRLTNEQWAALQAHLEYCPQCRNYERHLQSLEKDLSRSLHFRWNPVAGPYKGLSQEVVENRDRRVSLNRYLIRGGAGLLAALVLVGFFIARQAYISRVSPKPTPSGSPIARNKALPLTPTPKGTFQGLLAFAAPFAGNSDIYLLNSGPTGTELTNLTQTSFQETFPTWSPDGEWIAFLSDRAGKNDIYVIHVAGSHLTRLTDRPDLDWIGPLTWSADGKWIAALARSKTQSDDPFVFMIPVDGRQPLRSVAHSRGVVFSPLFSPGVSSLAFQASLPPGQLYSYDYQTGWYAPVNTNDLVTLGMRAAGPMAWVGGQSLVYLADGPYNQGNAPQVLEKGRSELHLSSLLNENNATIFTDTSTWILDSAPGLGRYRSTGWIPNSLLAVSVQDRGNGCLSLWLHQTNQPNSQASAVEGLCLDQDISRESWQPVGTGALENWLVVIAHRPGEKKSSYYAIKLPAELVKGSQPISDAVIEEIGVPGFNFSSDHNQWPDAPQVRQRGPGLGITPMEVQPSGPLPSAYRPEADYPGRLVSTLLSPVGSSLITMKPDGSDPQILTMDNQVAACPVFSPDGSKIAFLQKSKANSASGFELFVMDPSSPAPIRLTDINLIQAQNQENPEQQVSYSCPAWSPDGAQVAMISRSGPTTYLIDAWADNQKPAISLLVDASPLAPVWMIGSDGNPIIILVHPLAFSNPLHADAIDPVSPLNLAAAKDGTLAEQNLLFEIPGFNIPAAVKLSPDGQKVALIAVRYVLNSTVVEEVKLFTGDVHQLRASVSLTNYDPERSSNRNLAWGPDGRLKILHPLILNATDKTLVEIYDPEKDALQTIIAQPDFVSNAAWSPDGKWIFMAGETGLWSLNIAESLLGQALPAPIYMGWSGEVDFH